MKPNNHPTNKKLSLYFFSNDIQLKQLNDNLINLRNDLKPAVII